MSDIDQGVDSQPPIIDYGGPHDRPRKADPDLVGQEAAFDRAGLTTFDRAGQDDAFGGDEEEQVGAAADELASSRPAESEPVEINFRDPETGEYTADHIEVDGKDLAFRSSDEAAEALKAYRDNNDAIDDFREDADFLESLGIDPVPPNLAESLVQQQAEQAPVEQPIEQPADPDSELFTRVLENDVIRGELQRQLSVGEQVKAEYASKLGSLVTLVEQGLAEKYPELAGVRDATDYQARMQAIAHANPQRAQFIGNNIQSDLQRAQTVLQAGAQAKAEAAQRESQQFAAYRAEQGRLYDQKYGPVNESDGRAFRDYARGIGLSDSEVSALISNPLANDHRFQKMMLDAARYNALKDAPARAINKPVPPVQRPGVSAPMAVRQGTRDISSASAKLNQSGSLDDAVEMLNAIRASRGR
jgi:hypothetical protein